MNWLDIAFAHVGMLRAFRCQYLGHLGAFDFVTYLGQGFASGLVELFAVAKPDHVQLYGNRRPQSPENPLANAVGYFLLFGGAHVAGGASGRSGVIDAYHPFFRGQIHFTDLGTVVDAMLGLVLFYLLLPSPDIS
ncbi:MAG: hypothetical protein ACYCTW_08780 [Sulfuricella sp.]